MTDAPADTVPGPHENRLGAGADVHVVVGTRPEAVKVAPVVLALRAAGLRTALVDTGQQPARVHEALASFGLVPDVHLGVVRRDGGLAELMALTLTAFDGHLAAAPPRLVLVQGDTTTALTVSLAGALRQLPVAHLEAGLRTGDRARPFPEEMNRVLLAGVAELHLAPTPRALAALLREGVPRERIVVTGNTVVDALDAVLPALRAQPRPTLAARPDGARLLVVTVHRREAWGEGVRAVCGAVATLLEAHPDLRAVVVTHPNPAVAADVAAVLDGVERARVVPPLPYDEVLALLLHTDLLLTDSGGLQEEAPTLGLPVLVARDTTERPEGIEAGWAELVGLDPAVIVAAATAALAGGGSLPTTPNPYGDGRAAQRTAAAIGWFLDGGPRPVEWDGTA
ncbi:UDP-N-acetylglucosamine 2-epimerase (non-hydrolyzing) [Rhodococcus antarcticus]|uniref:UDP-N-acetylglucosamine 2-epimerase (non-hydrolyzing) n=1 Tax=Rhodococcus antarcticus TaxID=2987751 RepID=A0ABY6P0V2_9NOCA|nr:UDP-N-acetylglucosamine 2-epimerase (non-hydrolyzing) [Rhodococcus antarcticus]UZJ24981.1 UDP-N-acetylglucosamine 2-epimerase (non-hydrolyzing) [Rhodococcus antarcticus]